MSDSAWKLRGLEWRTIPLGDCRKDFLYCEGLRPRFFQCSDDTVFAGDRCVPYSQAGSECGECLKGDKKKSPNCHNVRNCLCWQLEMRLISVLQLRIQRRPTPMEGIPL